MTTWITLAGGAQPMGAQATAPPQPRPHTDPFPREGPPHVVELASFRIARHPVTVDEYRQFLEHRQAPPPLEWERQLRCPDHPVVGVSWHEATAMAVAHHATLPTEAQWEHAARGLTGRRFPWGEGPPRPELLNSIESGFGTTTPVDRHVAGATPEGVQDLAGNVWEWCADGYGAYEQLTTPRTGARVTEDDAPRVFRGGCFAARAIFSRGAMRAYGDREQRFIRRGFRLAQSSG